MFRKTRIKIVAAIMSILVCLFLGTLAVIFASSYLEVSASNFDMLEKHAQMYGLTGPIGDDEQGNRPPQ